MGLRKKCVVLTAGFFRYSFLPSVFWQGVWTRQRKRRKGGEDIVQLVWYQVGETQKDDGIVFEEVNRYIRDKIRVQLDVEKVSWSDYNQKMQVLIQTGDNWDLCFT